MYFDAYLRSKTRKLWLAPKHLEAVRKSKMCQTSALGMSELGCPSCGDVVEVLRSCRHRFCSRCGSIATRKWGAGLKSRLLDIKHHHIVMTLPKAYRGLSKRNGTKLYDILFRSSAKAIERWFSGRYGLRVGVVSVLHTAGSDLKYHPHVHMLVSRGGLHKQTGSYRAIPGDYLCSQRELGYQFRQLFEEELLRVYRKEGLKLYPKLKEEQDLLNWMRIQKGKHWIISIQKPLRDIDDIVGYIGRYTRRACISEYKLESIEGGMIRYRYTDYKGSKRGERPKEAIKEQAAEEFLDALLQHVPNKGYRMVRYSGLYNSYYSGQLPVEWKQKGKEAAPPAAAKDLLEVYRAGIQLTGRPDPLLCGYCGIYREVIRVVYPKRIQTLSTYEIIKSYEDTS